MFIVGIDIGGMSIKIGLVDKDGKIIAKNRKVTAKTADECISGMVEQIDTLLKENNVYNIYKETVLGVDTLLSGYGIKREGMIYTGSSDKTIALFCHFAMGITVLSYLLGMSPIVAQNNFFLAPTSVTTLVTETDSKGFSHFRAVSVGDISHLYIKGEPMSESGLYPDFEA